MMQNDYWFAKTLFLSLPHTNLTLPRIFKDLHAENKNYIYIYILEDNENEYLYNSWVE